MPQPDPRVDAYLQRTAPFAQALLGHLRQQVHLACPGVQETIKWGMPFFEWQGRSLAHMAGFKAHCALGIWLGDALQRPQASTHAMGNCGRLTTLADLPEPAELQRLLVSARQAIDSALAAPPPKAARRPPPAVPADLAAALATQAAAASFYAGLPPSAQREYVAWLDSAKRSDTRARRLAQAVDKLGRAQRLDGGQ